MKSPNNGSHIKTYKYQNGEWYPIYWYDTPVSVWPDAEVWENLLANAPYYNCLDVVTMRSQKMYSDIKGFYYLEGDVAYNRNLQVTQRNASGIHTNYYQYWESIDTLGNDYSTVPTFHWRPFTVDDLVSYTSHYHMAATDYTDLYKGGITNIYTDDSTGTSIQNVLRYWSLPKPVTETGANWSSAKWVAYHPEENAPMTPVLKIDLSKYHNWHIVKD